MDSRILIGVVFGLVLVAFGGFYFALSPRSSDVLPGASAPNPVARAPATADSAAPAPLPPPAPPPMATAASIEAEMALSDQAELLALLKKNFPEEYNKLIETAVRRRNEGASDTQFGQELYAGVQEIMRTKLKYGVGATMPTIDRLAANEASLFHALGTDGARFCMRMLGKDDTPADGPQPDSVRQLMQLGTLYRFQAAVEGLANTKPVDALSAEEMRSFEGSLAREGLNLKEVTTGTYLNAGAGNPGKPCLTLETLHLAIARLPEATRRKIYAGMFFLGRDK